MEKGFFYSTLNEFRKWAEEQHWNLVVYDPVHPRFITPYGQVVSLTVDEEEYVTGVRHE